MGTMDELILAVTIHWTGILDWTTGLSYFPFLDNFLYLFLKEAHFFTIKK